MATDYPDKVTVANVSAGGEPEFQLVLDPDRAKTFKDKQTYTPGVDDYKMISGALNHSGRLRILQVIVAEGKPLSLEEIAGKIGDDPAYIYYGLGVLEEAGLVHVSGQAPQKLYGVGR